MKTYSTGANKSPYDLRTFAYVPSNVPISGGIRYKASDIEDQSKVGICTAISMTQNAQKALKVKFSADFQYLLQKKYIDKNWNEGSSISSALKVAKNYGLLPAKKWKYTTQEDRDLGYEKYIEKLKAIPEEEIQSLLKIATLTKIKAYSSVPVDRDLMAQAINESSAGLLTRHVVGREWWTKPIEPIRKAKVPISGHAVTESDYDGNKFWIANSWGDDWADKGSAYRDHETLTPTEAWLVYYEKTPAEIDKQLEARKKKMALIVDLLQQVVVLYQKLNKQK
jgi:hypothetical protein